MLKRLAKKQFVQNVSKLMLGSGLGQLVSFAAAPFIARLYGPESFGEQSAVLSIVAPLAALSSMAFPIAIVVARTDNDAIALSWLAFGSSLVLSSMTTLLLLANDMWLLHQMGLEEIGAFAALIPILVVLTTMNMSAGYMMTRQGAFGLSAKAAVAAATVGNLSKLAFGVVSPGTLSLIAGNALGYLVTPLMAFRLRWQGSGKAPQISFPELKVIALHHRDFPMLRAPQNFLAAISQAMPVIGLTAGFGAAAGGHYAMAMALAGAPIMLIGNAVQSVLYPRFTKAYNEGQDTSRLLLQSTLSLSVLGAPLFMIFAFIGTPLFEFLLGTEWRAAGTFSGYLMLSLWFWLICRPSMAIIPVLALQKDLLIYELVGAGIKIMSIAIGIGYFADEIWTVGLYSAVSAAIWQLLVINVISKNKSKRQAVKPKAPHPEKQNNKVEI